MGWHGGGFGHGGHGGPGGHGGSRGFGRAASGLPFGGIPSEMLPGVRRLLEAEPDHPEPEVRFTHAVPPDQRGFSLTQLLRPHWWAVAVGVVLVVVETVSLQVGPQLTQRAIDQGILRGDFGVVAAMAAFYLGAIVVNGLAGVARVAWSGRLGQLLMYRVRLRVFAHIQRLSLDFFTQEKTGRIMTRMTSDIDALTELLQDGIINLFVQVLTLVYVLVVLFSMSPRLALIVALVIVPAMTVLTLWFRSSSERSYNLVRERVADVMAHLQESLSGIRIVTAYNRQSYNEVEHRNIVGDHRGANEDAARAAAIYGPGTDAIGILGTGLVLLLGGRMVLRGTLGLGELVAFVLYLNAFFGPIQQLVQLYNTFQSGQAAVAKLRDLLATEPSVRERPDAVELPPVEGEVAFCDVDFDYRAGEPVLRQVNLHVRAGETVALVGTTGAGKSTLAKLVPRLYDPTGGRVLIDGQDVRAVTLASLRTQVAMVPQEPFLYGGTIRDNIAFARLGARDEEIRQACAAVGLDELLDRLPDGLDTPVSERGASLSSGERQLLALARAVLASPRVLILDEATSALDLRSEAVVERALDNVLQGRTAIIIAHRLSTAMRADRIVVLADGGVAESGSHAELVGQEGIYAGMYRAWTTQVPRMP
ncbi:MAG: ABC transporter ATP-binding protein/permease [Actinobacteria bacterium]|nr:ABC transporter ATP-binding protein/permease [Actinomycetota bacterium]